MVSNASTSLFLYNTTTTTGTSFTSNSPAITFPKAPAKYWWKFTHYECPLCGTIDTVRERVNVFDQAKPDNDEDRHIDKEMICGYHFT
jgi:hypothetical protein